MIDQTGLAEQIWRHLPAIPTTDPHVALPPHVLHDAAQLARDTGQHHLARLLTDPKIIQPAVVARRHADIAAQVALACWAQGIARADLDRWAPPPRPPLMIGLHQHIIWSHWTNPGQLATSLRSYADRLDAAATRRLHTSLQDEAA